MHSSQKGHLQARGSSEDVDKENDMSESDKVKSPGLSSTQKSSASSSKTSVSSVKSMSENRQNENNHRQEDCFDSGEMVYGQKLLDDLMNTFCDKLQAAAPRKIEGCLAIQFLMVEEASALQKFVTGKNLVLQLLFDRARTHYLLTVYKPQQSPRVIQVYDSLQCYQYPNQESNGADKFPIFTPDLHYSIRSMYEHLFPPNGDIAIAVDEDYDQQEEDWSCGYRAIAALVDIARGRQPGSQFYSRRKIYEFMHMILNVQYPTWEMFECADLGRGKRLANKSVYMVTIPRVIDVRFTQRSSQQSSTTSAPRSEKSQSQASSRASSSSSVGPPSQSRKRAGSNVMRLMPSPFGQFHHEQQQQQLTTQVQQDLHVENSENDNNNTNNNYINNNNNCIPINFGNMQPPVDAATIAAFYANYRYNDSSCTTFFPDFMEMEEFWSPPSPKRDVQVHRQKASSSTSSVLPRIVRFRAPRVPRQRSTNSAPASLHWSLSSSTSASPQ